MDVISVALGAFLGSSDSGDSDVECFSSSNLQEPMVMPGFNTETFHAQYRVLEAFSIFNILLSMSSFRRFFLILTTVSQSGPSS